MANTGTARFGVCLLDDEQIRRRKQAKIMKLILVQKNKWHGARDDRVHTEAT